MVSSLLAQSWTPSSPPSSPAPGPLEALALGDGQTATGVLVGRYHPVSYMIAVY